MGSCHSNSAKIIKRSMLKVRQPITIYLYTINGTVARVETSDFSTRETRPSGRVIYFPNGVDIRVNQSFITTEFANGRGDSEIHFLGEVLSPDGSCRVNDVDVTKVLTHY